MPERIQQLSAAMAAGDSEAVEAFYRQYFDFLYRQARRCTRRDESFCLDVVQDATLRIIRTVRAVEAEPQFLGWLKLVVQTTSFDLLRNERRRKNREAMAGVSPVNIEPDTDSLQLDWLSEQISKLDPELVRMIELRFERRWSLKRIGQAMGISIGAVDGRLRRALRKMELSAVEEPSEQPPALPISEIEIPSPGLPLGRQVQLSPIESAPNVVVLTEQIAVESKFEEPHQHGLALSVVRPTPIEPYDTEPVRIELRSEQPDRHGPALPIHEPESPLPVLPIQRQVLAAEAASQVVDTVPVVPPIETTDDSLIGLEDEAGAYDDRL